SDRVPRHPRAPAPATAIPRPSRYIRCRESSARPRLARRERSAIVAGKPPNRAAAFFEQAELLACLFLPLSAFAPARFVPLRLAGSDGVKTGGGGLHRQGHDIDGGLGDGADAAGEEGCGGRGEGEVTHGYKHAPTCLIGAEPSTSKRRKEAPHEV